MENVFTKARARLLMRAPFFGALGLRLDAIPDPSIKTAATDGKVVRYNAAWFKALPLDVQVTVVAHEAAHCLLAHHIRQGGRDHSKWNVAADHAVNWLLKRSDFTMPSWALCDDKFQDMAAERVYDLLPQDQQDPDQGQGQGQQDPGGMGSVVPALDKPQAEIESRQAIASAAAYAEKVTKGGLSDPIRRMVDAAMKTTMPWHSVLRDMLVSGQPRGYSWARPNKRHIGRGLYMPSRSKDKRLPYAVIAIDTSGSMTQEALTRILSEVRPLVQDLIERVTILQCDDALQDVKTFDAAYMPTDLMLVGGGNTDFRPVFQWIETVGMAAECDPSVVLYFSDGYGTFPDRAPMTPVVWVLTTDQKTPFGDSIRMA